MVTSKTLRILYHHRTAAKDGMSVHIEALIGAFRRLGHEVLVVGPSGDERDSGGRVEVLANTVRRLLPRPVSELIEIGYDQLARERLAAAVRAFQPDILYERYNLFLEAGLRVRRKYSLPMILEVNAPLAEEREAYGGIFWRRLAYRSQKRLWREADIVLPVSGVLADRVVAERGTRSGVVVVPNGVDANRFNPETSCSQTRTRLGLDGKIVVGFAGFVRDWHGVDWALNALPSLPVQTIILIVGEGPALADLSAQAKQSGLSDRVRIVGTVSHDQMPSYLAAFDIALQPRAVAYASPLKLFEYMASGRAILAPNQANIREICRHDVTAVLFEPDDQASFVAGLSRLCSDKDLRTRLGCAARQEILSIPYSWDNNAARIIALCEKAMAHRRD